MTRMNRTIAFTVALVFAASAACGGGSDDGGGGPTPVVATVTVTPNLDTLASLGTTLQYTAIAREADNTVISGKSFAWSSSQAAATITGSGGLATAVAEGTTTITATADGVGGNATLVVKLPAPVGGTIQGAVSVNSSFTIRAQRSTKPASSTGPAASGSSKAGTKVLPQRQRLTPLKTKPSRTRADSVPGEWIVSFRPAALGVPPVGSFAYGPAASQRAASAMRAALADPVANGRASLMGTSPAILTARIRTLKGVSASDLAAELRSNPAILSVKPNYFHRAFGRRGPIQSSALVPNDPLLPFQAWHYSMIGLPRAWQITTGSSGVLVAVIDNGIRFDHPGIAPNLTNDGYDFASNDDVLTVCSGGTIGVSGDGDGYDANPTNPIDVVMDDDLGCVSGVSTSGNHGLHVAGTIGSPGNDGIGGTGVAWNVRIRPIRALGLAGGSDYDIAQAVLYAAGLAADNGHGGTVTAPSRAPIINMSLGGPGPAPAEQAAVTAATAAGSLVIAAAGNNGDAVPMYPASFPEVMSVSAVGPDGQLASYSSFGTAVDIAAPGGDLSDGDGSFGILSTAWNYQTNQPIYDNESWNGTSMAAPHVAGVAALVLSANPGLTNSQLRSRLENFGSDIGAVGTDAQYGHGLLNPYGSLTQTAGPPASTRVFLYNASTGALVTSAAAGAGGTYQFTGLAAGSYRVYAGQDESADGVFGRGFRRWGAFGGSATPTTITVSGTATSTANFVIGIPIELENNNSIANADPLPIGGYLAGFFSNPGTDIDFARVDIPSNGQYTFETIPLGGACGFALEEDTVLELQAVNGTPVATNDDINTDGFNYCSKITITLTPGTYYLRTTAYSGAGAANLLNRRYSISARAET